MLFRMRTPRTLWQRTLLFLWPRRGVRRGWQYIAHRVKRISASPHAIAIGFAAGVFASFTPFIGFHFVIAGIIAFVFGGSILASALGTAVGNPLTFPFIWIATYNVGAMLLGHDLRDKIAIHLPPGFFKLLFSEPTLFWRAFWKVLEPVLMPMSVGSLVLGIPAALVFYLALRRAVESYQQRRRRLALRVRKVEHEA
jgi:hypothetical protein